ncbi:MAG: TolC family protein [Cyanobacteriota bacterium]|nr:TolC family protein [Cyanobacteriota bacterium]
MKPLDQQPSWSGHLQPLLVAGLVLTTWMAGDPLFAQSSPAPSPQPTLTPTETPSPEETTSGDPALPSGDITLPPPPPQLGIPADVPSPSISPTPTAEQLVVPDSPLEVRIVTTQGLSLQAALDLASQNNPSIRQAELAVIRAQTSLDQARAAYSLTLSGSSRYTYSQPPDQGNPQSGDSSSLSSTPLRVDYTVLDGGLRDSATQAAQESLTIAQLELAETIQTVRLSVASAYYDLQNSNAQVAINQAAVANSEASLKDAQVREQAGLGTRFDVLQAETELANNQQSLISAQNTQQLSRRRLAELLNFASPTDVTATDPIQPFGAWDLSLEETIVAAFANRQALEVQRRTLQRAKDQAINALAANKPQVSLFATFDTGYNLQIDDSFDVGYSAGANFSVTYFDGGAAAAQKRGFDVDGDIAISQFDQARNEIQRGVEDAFLTLNSSREQIESSKTAIVSAEESLRLARLRFQAGVGTQTDVISAETALTRARGNLSSAIIGYNRALSQLQRAIGEL